MTTPSNRIRISNYLLDQSTALVVLQLIFAGLLGGVSSNQDLASQYTISGFMVLFLALVLLHLSSRRSIGVKSILYIGAYVIYAVLPFFALQGQSPLGIGTTAYLISLLVLPLFLNVYRPQVHLVAVVLVVQAIAVAQAYLTSLTNDSLLIISVTALFSLIYTWRRQGSPSTASATYHYLNTDRYLPQQMSQAWHCLMLQASVLLLLLFVDLLGGTTSAMPVQLKLIGLASLIVSAYLMIGIRRESVTFRMTLSTLLVGMVVSLSTLWVDPERMFYAALPTIYILGLTSVYSWPPGRHLGIVAWLATVDIALRLGLDFSTQNRAAIVLVCVGAIIAIVSGRIKAWLQHEPLQMDAIAHEHAELEVITSMPLRDRFFATQLQMVVVWQRWYAGAAVLFCTFLVSRNAASSFWLVLIGVGLLLAVHAVLERILRKGSMLQVGWLLAFCSFAISALWSGIPLLYFEATELFYLYWVCTLMLGLALCPWRMQELLTITLLCGLLGLESVEHLALSIEESLAVFIFLFGAVFLSRVLEFLLRGSILTRIGFHSLDKAESIHACEKSIAEIVLITCNAHAAFVRNNQGRAFMVSEQPHAEDRVERMRTLVAVSQECSYWPISTNVAFSAMRVPLQVGVAENQQFQHTHDHALLLRLDGRHQQEVYQLEVFLVRPLPFVGIEKALITADMILEMASARISTLAEQAQTVSLRKTLLDRDALRDYELSAMVHDINNTVQDLTLLCESIREELASSEVSMSVTQDIGLIEGTARSIAHIVSDAKRRRELEQLDDLEPREFVELADVVKDVVAFAQLRAERKGINVTTCIETREPCVVRVSVREHIEAVLRNLLQNAIAYSSKGAKVTVRLERNKEMLVLEVADNGVGLNEEELIQVFEQGYRGRVRDVAHGGLGLGLAQSRRVVHAAGGTLSARSEGPGSGAVFRVELPRAKNTQHLSQADWALLVDDEPRLISYYERLVQACGLQSRAASSVLEVQEILNTYGPPTIVITDLHLGQDQGEEVLAEVRSRFGQSIPVLVITGIRDRERTDHVRTLGATEIIYKPIGQRALFARIESSIPRPMVRMQVAEEESSEEPA